MRYLIEFYTTVSSTMLVAQNNPEGALTECNLDVQQGRHTFVTFSGTVPNIFLV